MKIQEVSELLHLSKRAIKFYEEKGLLEVKKDKNGYRNYVKENIEILDKISVYRKLGIDLASIQEILVNKEKEKDILEKVYIVKQQNIKETKEQLVIIEQLIQKAENYHVINQTLDYQCIADALCDMIPGSFGQMYMHHFLPYLQISFDTPEQKEAYVNIITFFDQVDLKVTFSMKIIYWLQKVYGKKDMAMLIKRIDDNIKRMLHPTDEEYEQMKMMVLKNYKKQNAFYYKYSIFGISKRRHMQQLQACGYNDVFLPNMEKLCPKYKVYRQALWQINTRICKDLGLYYDASFQLCKRK